MEFVFHYDIVKVLGYGGLGVVDEVVVTSSEAPDVPVNSRLARKRLNDKFRNNPIAMQRFEREIAALGKMRHPGIVPLRGVNYGGERCYMMTCYANNLRESMAEHGPWPWSDVAWLGRGLADALAHAHSHSLLHRDMKPENVLVTSDGKLVIADWGLGYFIHRDSAVMTALTNGGMGTAYYCSWEQWSTGKCQASGDVYSLGMMLAEMVEGRQRPMTMTQVGTGLTSDVGPMTSEGAKRFSAVLRKMTNRNPLARHQTMTQVISDLDWALDASTAVG